MTDHTGSSYKGYIGIDRKSGDMDQSPRPLTQTLTFGLWDGVIPMIHAWGWGGGEFGGNSAKEFEKGNMNWLNLNPSFPKEKKRVTTVVRNLRNIVKKQQKGCSPRVRGAPNRPKPGNVLICGFLLFHSYYLSLVISFIYRTKTLTVTRKHI